MYRKVMIRLGALEFTEDTVNTWERAARDGKCIPFAEVRQEIGL